ncbi:hypothetical protein C5P79_004828, partial [Salmonella enterica subsp. enterica serovar 4,[5],12:i:-]|nr:hypothetical protein [Salmonella enterica subsp. enterica serovar 4,[5],12:i:-]
QVKKGKLDASGVSKSTNSNVAEIHNQVLMMLGHEIFDPETNRKGKRKANAVCNTCSLQTKLELLLN